MSYPKTMGISDTRLGEPKLYNNCVGDTWDLTWGADGDLFSPGNDGSGWNRTCSNNLFFNRISGNTYDQLTGQTINCMEEYGGWAKEGPDGCTWKSSGCVSIDGIIYLALARHKYGTKSGDPFLRQTAQNASIIKSTDLGVTWERSAAVNYDQPMFPGSSFATPYFIYYGQDGQSSPVDLADTYIYAVSNNGFWCNGDNYILGRISRADIARLNASDWSFYTGGDGMFPHNWSQVPQDAMPIIENPLKCGETGATYLPALERYILVAWYYPGNPNVETDETHFIYYEAPHPWGPWIEIKEDVIRPYGWYCPRVLSGWHQVGEDEIQAVIATGGDYYEMDKYYVLTLVPIRIKAGGKFPPEPNLPQPYWVDDSDLGQFSYQGSWTIDINRDKAERGSEHRSAQKDDFFVLPFTGSRLKWYASKDNNHGIAAVSIDDDEEILVDQYTYCTEPQYQRLLFDSGLLQNGRHTLKVRVTGEKNEKSTGFAVDTDKVEITE